MLKRISLIVISVGIIALVVIRLVNNKDTTQKRVYQYNKEQAVPVKGDTVKMETIHPDNLYSGLFEPNKETRISAEVQGKINEVLVDLGSVVKKGQVLIRLDNALLKLQLQSINIQIEGLEADVKRYTVLAHADAVQGIQLEKSQLGLKAALVQKDILLEQINKSAIRSPFAGMVTAKLTEVGAFAAPGVPLLQITDISILKFTVNVTENDLNKFSLNQLSNVTADVYPEILVPGKIDMVGSKANMGNSFPVQFSVSNTPDFKIKSGMFGKVDMKNEGGEKKIVIPASAIVGTNIQPQVYIVKMGRAVLQNVTISDRIENKVILSNGLNEGEIVIINGFINLFDGANVNLK